MASNAYPNLRICLRGLSNSSGNARLLGGVDQTFWDYDQRMKVSGVGNNWFFASSNSLPFTRPEADNERGFMLHTLTLQAG